MQRLAASYRVATDPNRADEARSRKGNDMRFASLLFAVSFVFLAGCDVETGLDPVFVGAVQHRRVSPETLATAGLESEYRKSAFVCGGCIDVVHGAGDSAIQPPPPIPPAPEFDYIVDLTGVAQVRRVWFAGIPYTIITHPVKEAKAEHRSVTDRVLVDSPRASGAGPVTIWRGRHLVGFSDDPWMLVDVGEGRTPWLFSLCDWYRLGGPVEANFHTDLGWSFAGFWDAAATGQLIRLVSSAGQSGEPEMVIQCIDDEGEWFDEGRLCRRGQSYLFVPTSQPTGGG